MRVAIIADDLTGAADTGVQLARAGYRTAVAFRDAPIPPADDLDAVALDTDSRAMPAGFAAKRVMEAAHAVRDTPLVYKKLDSTLRGPIAAELAAASGASGRDRVVVAPAFPATGRTTVEGVQLVRGVPVHETEAKNDPRTPVREGHVPTLLAAAFPSVVSLSTEDLADPATVSRALEEARLRRGRRGARRGPRGPRAGCAGPIRGALGRVGRPRRRPRPRIPRPARRVAAPSACAGPQGAGRGGQPERSGQGAASLPGGARVRGGVRVRRGPGRRWGSCGRRCRRERARRCTPRRTGSHPAPETWRGRWPRSWALSPGRNSSTRWYSPGGTQRSGWRGGWARGGYGWRGRWRLASRWGL